SLRGGGFPALETVVGGFRESFEADAGTAPRHVEEQVGGDAVQAPLEGSGSVVGQRLDDADEDLLGEVFSVVLVAGQPVGEPVDPSRVGAYHLFPAWRLPMAEVGGRGWVCH